MKDWSGDKNSVFKTLGASNHTKEERQSEDFYATDPKAIDALIGAYELPHKIWEPACGSGCLSERLVEYEFDVCSSDLIDRGYGDSGVDFLTQDECNADCILTNPPYKYATEFVLHALDILPEGGACCMFLKTTFLEGKKRREKLFDKYPPLYILQFSERVLCAKNGEFERMKAGGGSAVAYAWFVWRKGYKGNTVIKWI